jgi:hypothetical protein
MAVNGPPTFDKKVSLVGFLFNDRYRPKPATELYELTAPNRTVMTCCNRLKAVIRCLINQIFQIKFSLVTIQIVQSVLAY